MFIKCEEIDDETYLRYAALSCGVCNHWLDRHSSFSKDSQGIMFGIEDKGDYFSKYFIYLDGDVVTTECCKKGGIVWHPTFIAKHLLLGPDTLNIYLSTIDRLDVKVLYKDGAHKGYLANNVGYQNADIIGETEAETIKNLKADGYVIRPLAEKIRNRLNGSDTSY